MRWRGSASSITLIRFESLVSSANDVTWESITCFVMSLKWIRKKMGSSTDPCGVPLEIEPCRYGIRKYSNRRVRRCPAHVLCWGECHDQFYQTLLYSHYTLHILYILKSVAHFFSRIGENCSGPVAEFVINSFIESVICNGWKSKSFYWWGIIRLWAKSQFVSSLRKCVLGSLKAASYCLRSSFVTLCGPQVTSQLSLMRGRTKAFTVAIFSTYLKKIL